MRSNVVDLRGSVLRTIDLDDRVFGITPNPAVVHQAVVTQQANARQGTHDTRTRGEVAGGGKKPYRQKGTGYARQGSKRAPHYRGGGVVFGPHPRSYEKALPRKMRRLALRSVLSARVAEDALTIVDAFTIDAGKTRALLAALATLGAADGALVVLGERSDLIFRAARNLDNVHVVTPNGLNLLDILRLPRMVLTESAVQELTRTLTADLASPMVPSTSPTEATGRPAPAAEAEPLGSPLPSKVPLPEAVAEPEPAARPRRARKGTPDPEAEADPSASESEARTTEPEETAE
ncbi:MAG TPA: 50S ribosomal protein L4 [Chloroflexota bacterium]|nr:50S ribosomal protein L4 [Chloroflexota bacterium]